LFLRRYGTGVLLDAKAGGRRRRTQEERSAETRTRLLDAAIECLLALGYAGTTTTEVAARAKVSRGAQLHHYPTKQELVTAAVEHLFDRRVKEFRAAFASLPPTADRATKAIDLLWEIFTGDTFYAVLELVVAARTNPDLRAQMTEIERRFLERVRETFFDLFPAPAERGPHFDLAPHFVMALMEGLALNRILDPDHGKRKAIVDLLKALSPLLEERTVDFSGPKR